MPTTYDVTANDWLSKIALKYNWNDGGTAIWNQNANLARDTGNNRNILETGWRLVIPPPPPPQKPAPGSVARVNAFQLPPPPDKQLVISLYEHLGTKAPSVSYVLYVNDQPVFKGSDFTGDIVIPFKDKKGNARLDEKTLTEATLVVQVRRRGVNHGSPQKIKVHIGGMSPLTLSNGSVSVPGLQKILTNLGYEPGAVDGVCGPKTQAAIRAFQADHKLPISGIPDSKTCATLRDKIKNPMRSPATFPGDNDAVFPGKDDPDIKPALGQDAQLHPGDEQYYQKNALWDPYDGWTERAAPPPGGGKAGYKILKGDETGLKLFDKTKGNTPPDSAFDGVPAQAPKFFPDEIYVAPGEVGDDRNKNPVWMLKYRTIFLDCGGWVNDQRDFAVIHGWHTYLCEYIPEEKRSGAAPRVVNPARGNPRMDHEFFRAVGAAVKIKKCVSAVWASKGDFDWANLTLIFPDIHLMTGLTTNVWKHNADDAQGPFYDLRAELDLFDFARTITGAAALQNNVKVIQLGDTYDLWIGLPKVLGHDCPLFASNKKSVLELEVPINIEFGPDKQYDYALSNSKQRIADRWKACGIPANFDARNVDMRIQVLQWWVEAIQGLRNSPLEQTYSTKSLATPWVKWILGRRSRVNSDKRNALTHLAQAYGQNTITGNGVAETLYRDFPEQFANIPGRPFVGLGEEAKPPEPSIRTVNNWFASVFDQLATFEGRVANYVQYVGSDLNGVWLNPAEAALRLCAAQYGNVEYLYGNHDNYLIRPEICGNVCPPRVRYIERSGMFIEHAHRLEPGLDLGSANYDGCPTGFELTNSVWRDKSAAIIPEESGGAWKAVKGAFGKVKDKVVHKGEFMDPAVTPLSQIYYRREAGRFLVGRRATGGAIPHIFVIGHTHAPILELNYVQLNDATDFRGPGNGLWQDENGI